MPANETTPVESGETAIAVPEKEASKIELEPIEKGSPLEKLSVRQALFAQRFAAHGYANRAAIECGYNPRSAAVTGYKMTHNPLVKAAIDWLRAKTADDASQTVDTVLKRLVFEAEYFGEGASAAARIRANELIGKWLGMWKEEGVQITANQPCKVFIGIDAERV